MACKRLFVSIFILLIISNFASLAQSDTLSVPVRPKVGLVLSGGGAKGMAHIGILKKLEEVGLYPDYITGTSMGSIVGALYSIGFTIDELENFAKKSDWLSLMTNNYDTKLVSIRQKDDYGWWPLEFSFENRKPVMSSGMIEAPNLSLFFSENTWCTVGINQFDDYPIPFRCYGVDILKDRLIEFSEGDLARAIRSSMAIPLVFSPVLIENQNDTMLIVDGGVMHNFPVEDVKKMGADIVIGAYTGFEDEVTVEEMNSITKITGRVLMFGGVNDSKQQMDSVDPRYRITPDLKGIQPSDFLQAEKIIKRGEEAANERLDDLKKLADSLNAIAPRPHPKRLPRHDTVVVNHVVINGLNLTNSENAYGIIGIADNQDVTPKMIGDAVNRLYATLLYKSINYSITTSDDGQITLTFNVKEKGQALLDLGFYYDEVYNIGFTMKYTRRSLWNKKYDAFVFLNLNQHPGLQAQISRNINHDNTLSLKSALELFLDYKTLYDSSLRLGDIKYHHFSWDLVGVEKAYGSHTKIGASTFYELFITDIDHDSYTALPDTNYTTYNQYGLRMKMKHNSLDDNIYPKEGALWDIEVKGVRSHKAVYSIGNTEYSESNYLRISTNVKYAATISKINTTFIPSASIGLGTSGIYFPDQFFIGGNQLNNRYGQTSFVGLRLNQIGVQNFGKMGITVRIEPFKGMGIELLKYVNILACVNATATYNKLNEIDLFNPEHVVGGYGEGILIRTPIGPISFVWSNNSYTRKDCYYFSLGFNLPYIK